MPPVLELRGITKRFPGVIANDHIDLTLEKGQILALLGENGAGKTTLMNILYGLYSPDEGEIIVNGKKLEPKSPNDAIHAGIGMVHQHFMLIPVFTVTENVILGDEPLKKADLLDKKTAEAKIREISAMYGLEVDPNAYIRDVPVGVQQRVEIIKLLYREADILILDEPTAVLTPQEADELFVTIKNLVAQGKSVIFITHKLREVLEFSDKIVVIRGGKVVGTTTPAEADQNVLAGMMVGRDVQLDLEKAPYNPGEKVLEVDNIKVVDSHNFLHVKGISFDVRAGEILGIAGVQGNGQTELVQAVSGLNNPVEGSIKFLGKDIAHASPKRIMDMGSAHIPEDRQKDGLVLAYTIYDNLVLNTYDHPPFAKGIIMQKDEILANATKLVENFDIRTPSINTTVGSLSGGNQQKVIVAREFSRPIKLLIAAQPTRGLDVGSIEYIHTRLLQKRDEGCAILLVSTELEEIMELSDRIGVIFDGKLVKILDAKTTTKEQLGLYMAGMGDSDAPVAESAEVAQ
ncbi:MAG TPA: ABC transporter ATP-binding protein [Bellilinea sp.]|nr:ABC transporter ATP-binding protein [Bellilinea sp.]